MLVYIDRFFYDAKQIYIEENNRIKQKDSAIDNSSKYFLGFVRLFVFIYSILNFIYVTY